MFGPGIVTVRFQGVNMYRSERLVDAAGSGGCVVSEYFPGIEYLFGNKEVCVIGWHRIGALMMS